MFKPTIVKSIWRVSIALFCLLFTFTIAYSQSALAIALLFWFIDKVQSGNRSSNKSFEKPELIAYATMGLFVGFCLLSGLVNGTFLYSASILKEHWLFLAIPVVADSFEDKRFRPWIIGSIVFSVALAGSYGIWQHFSGYSIRGHLPLHPAPGGSGYRAWGNFNQVLTYGNVMAAASALVIGLTFSKATPIWRVCIIYAALAGAAGAALSYSRGSFLGVIAAFLIAAIFVGRDSWKRAIPIVALAFAIAYFVVPDISIRLNNALQQVTGKELTQRGRSVARTTIWSMSWEMTKDNPFFGVGPGNFKAEYDSRAGDSLLVTFRHAHNDVLDIAAYAGIPAALAFLGIWGLALRMFMRALSKRRFAMLSGKDSSIDESWHYPALVGAIIGSLAFAVCSLTEATFADEEMRAALMLVWGIGFWASRSES